MKLSIDANICDQDTKEISFVLHKPLETISKELSGDYGGSIKHLWISFELNERHAGLRPPYPFRLQKKVGGGRGKLTGLPAPQHEDVGHYSVRPDFRELRSLPLEAAVGYALSLIYESTAVLVE